MKKRNIIYTALGCMAAVAVAGNLWIGQYNFKHGNLPSLGGLNVREKAHQHLTTLKKTDYSKQVRIDGTEYKITVKKIDSWAHVEKGLKLKIENLEKSGNRVSMLDEDSLRGAGEKPRFRNINELYVNGEQQETNKQREKTMDRFLEPLEKDLGKLVKEQIQRKENDWKSAISSKSDFVNILSVEYEHYKGGEPMITIGIEGYDNESHKEVHYYVDGDYIFSWDTPKTFESSGKQIEEKQLEAMKYTAVCLPLKEGFSVTTGYKILKKGEHTLKAVLEDYQGNRNVEDTFIFEVKSEQLP